MGNIWQQNKTKLGYNERYSTNEFIEINHLFYDFDSNELIFIRLQFYTDNIDQSIFLAFVNVQFNVMFMKMMSFRYDLVGNLLHTTHIDVK